MTLIKTDEDRAALMAQICIEATESSEAGIGGPFGAAVVKDGKLIATGTNRVLEDRDPTAHAEVTAIRRACQALGTHDLSGCELYATGSCCPMCLSAAIWANIKTVYYCNDSSEAAKIGFRDDFIFDYIKTVYPQNTESSPLTLIKLRVPEGDELYKQYATSLGVIY